MMARVQMGVNMELAKLDAEDQKFLEDLLKQAQGETARLNAEGIQCTRGEAFAFLLWRRDHPKTGQIYPR
jgi:hypothetical protein